MTGQTWVNVLDLAASVLVLAGLVWGGAKLINARSRLQREREAARQIQQESTRAFQHGQTYDRRAEERKRGVRRGLTMADTAHLQQDVELMIVEYLRPQLAWPFVLATLGTAMAFVEALLVICGVGT